MFKMGGHKVYCLGDGHSKGKDELQTLVKLLPGYDDLGIVLQLR